MAPEIAPADVPNDAVVDVGKGLGFPLDVAAWSRPITADLVLHDLGTSADIAGAVALRRREYVAGRLCAHAALKALGVDRASLGRKPDGAPRWPEGIVGSIAHSRRQAIAVAARVEDYRSIGVDVEDISGVTAELWPIIATTRELALLRNTDAPDRPLIATTIFSAKEALYKCQFPLTQQFLNFQDVEIDIHGDRFSVVLKCSGPVSALEVDAFRGSIHIYGGEVVTLVDLLV